MILYIAELAVAVLSGFACGEEFSCGKYAILQDTIETTLGFHVIYPLTKEEILMLWPLIIQRSIVNIISQERELLMIDPDNTYNKEGVALEWMMLSRIQKIPYSFAQYVVYQSIYGSSELNSTLSITAVSKCNLRTHIVDVSVTSYIYSGGNWLQEECSRKAVDRSISHIKLDIKEGVATLAIIPAGTAHLYRSRFHANPTTSHLTISLYIHIFLSLNSNIYAPWEGQLYNDGHGGYILHSEALNCDLHLKHMHIDGDAVNHKGHIQFVRDVAAREMFGKVSATGEDLPTHIAFQVTSRREMKEMLTLPLFVNQCAWSYYERWILLRDTTELSAFIEYLLYADNRITIDHAIKREVCGLDQARHHALLSRDVAVAKVQEHYYKDALAPNIERGYGSWLYDIYGRRYLDMVNNVAVVGHCHPQVVAAANDQHQLLNTNSRFIYSKLGEFAEMILSKIPESIKKKGKLNTVLFVNSGSEATDLALRISRSVVNARRVQQGVRKCGIGYDVVCLEGAYHGVTTASDEISTTLNDNPQSRENRPPWVHLCPMPNPIRGMYNSSNTKQEDMGEKYAEHVSNKIKELVQLGTPPCCFIAEPLSGNAGGVCLPNSYLSRVYHDIRSVGGLCIADEVQVKPYM